jgi:hypothetical protein
MHETQWQQPCLANGGMHVRELRAERLCAQLRDAQLHLRRARRPVPPRLEAPTRAERRRRGPRSERFSAARGGGAAAAGSRCPSVSLAHCKQGSASSCGCGHSSPKPQAASSPATGVASVHCTQLRVAAQEHLQRLDRSDHCVPPGAPWQHSAQQPQRQVMIAARQLQRNGAFPVKPLAASSTRRSALLHCACLTLPASQCSGRTRRARSRRARAPRQAPQWCGRRRQRRRWDLRLRHAAAAASAHAVSEGSCASCLPSSPPRMRRASSAASASAHASGARSASDTVQQPLLPRRAHGRTCLHLAVWPRQERRLVVAILRSCGRATAALGHAHRGDGGGSALTWRDSRRSTASSAQPAAPRSTPRGCAPAGRRACGAARWPFMQ